MRSLCLVLMLAMLVWAEPGRSVRDVCANEWSLERLGEGKWRLMVRPAQAPAEKVVAEVPGLEPDRWESVTTGEDGFIWLTREGRHYRFDPRHPEKGIGEGSPGSARIPRQSAWRVVARMPESNHDLTGAVVAYHSDATALFTCGAYSTAQNMSNSSPSSISLAFVV